MIWSIESLLLKIPTRYLAATRWTRAPRPRLPRTRHHGRHQHLGDPSDRSLQRRSGSVLRMTFPNRLHSQLFPLGAGDALPTTPFPNRARWTLAVAIFPRVYPFLRACAVQFASPTIRTAWNALDIARPPGSLCVPAGMLADHYRKHSRCILPTPKPANTLSMVAGSLGNCSNRNNLPNPLFTATSRRR